MRFSRRTSWDRAGGAAAHGLGEGAVDLTETNPTNVGLASAIRVAEIARGPVASRYVPDPFGSISAREAVARYHVERGGRVTADRVVLAASTSEAYAWLFKLLADPGDEVLVPTPSYPLFDCLASLEGVRVVSYPLSAAEGFRVDTASLEARVTERTRAIVVVHPNNPTGTLVREDDAREVERVAAGSGAAIVADEVFADYLHAGLPAGVRPTFLGEPGCLTFVLSGLSKVCCAPQLKLGWLCAAGPDDLVREALARLEVVADTYLSVATPVMLAAPAILARRAEVQAELSARVRKNLAALDAAIAGAGAGAGMRRLASHGGWTALVSVPRVMPEDAWVRRFAESGVLVQPGWLFDFDDGGTFALSLIVDPEAFERGARALVGAVVRAID